MMEQGAVLIFPDENCELMPKRFYWSNGDDGENGTKYDKADLALQAINKFSIKSLRDLFRKQDKKSGNYLAKSVQVPPGFMVTLYEEKHWSGTSKQVMGKTSRKASYESLTPTTVYEKNNDEESEGN